MDAVAKLGRRHGADYEMLLTLIPIDPRVQNECPVGSDQPTVISLKTIKAFSDPKFSSSTSC